jgi:hypothetical protein
MLISIKVDLFKMASRENSENKDQKLSIDNGDESKYLCT